MNPRRRYIQIISACALVLGAALAMHAVWVPVKAEVAQVLLHQAWQRSLLSGEAERPWPWADHYPIGKLSAPQHTVDQIVLAGDSGSVLAFAPGENMQARALPNAARVISGHRDTHFRFLERVALGDRFQLEDSAGAIAYRVTDRRVVDANQVAIHPELHPGQLLLVTCYPFDALTTGGSLRYVVTAERIL